MATIKFHYEIDGRGRGSGTGAGTYSFKGMNTPNENTRCEGLYRGPCFSGDGNDACQGNGSGDSNFEYNTGSGFGSGSSRAGGGSIYCDGR